MSYQTTPGNHLNNNTQQKPHNITPTMKQTPLTAREAAAALALALVAVAAGVAAFKAFAAILWAFYYAGALM